jgi:hypothetical protein
MGKDINIFKIHALSDNELIELYNRYAVMQLPEWGIHPYAQLCHNILQTKNAERLVRETQKLTQTTWGLAIATWFLAISTLVITLISNK